MMKKESACVGGVCILRAQRKEALVGTSRVGEGFGGWRMACRVQLKMQLVGCTLVPDLGLFWCDESWMWGGPKGKDIIQDLLLPSYVQQAHVEGFHFLSASDPMG